MPSGGVVRIDAGGRHSETVHMLKAARSALIGACAASLLYAANDVAAELTTYVRLRQEALRLAQNNASLCSTLGGQLTAGPWYNASLMLSQNGHVAKCTMQVVGNQRVSDVVIRASRTPGLSPAVWFNLVGPANWTITMCSALLPAGGGAVKPVSLLPAKVGSSTNTVTS